MGRWFDRNLSIRGFWVDIFVFSMKIFGIIVASVVIWIFACLRQIQIQQAFGLGKVTSFYDLN